MFNTLSDRLEKNDQHMRNAKWVQTSKYTQNIEFHESVRDAADQTNMETSHNNT